MRIYIRVSIVLYQIHSFLAHMYVKQLSLPGIRNRVAIVNGAASGIGRGICLSLFEQGADVVCVDLKSAEENANETLRILKEARPSGKCTFIACDVLDRSQIEVKLAEVASLWDHTSANMICY